MVPAETERGPLFAPFGETAPACIPLVGTCNNEGDVCCPGLFQIYAWGGCYCMDTFFPASFSSCKAKRCDAGSDCNLLGTCIPRTHPNHTALMSPVSCHNSTSCAAAEPDAVCIDVVTARHVEFGGSAFGQQHRALADWTDVDGIISAFKATPANMGVCAAFGNVMVYLDAAKGLEERSRKWNHKASSTAGSMARQHVCSSTPDCIYAQKKNGMDKRWTAPLFGTPVNHGMDETAWGCDMTSNRCGVSCFTRPVAWRPSYHELPNQRSLCGSGAAPTTIGKEGDTAPKGTPCHFPFVYNGEEYYSCTAVGTGWDGSPGDGQHGWCYTSRTGPLWGTCGCNGSSQGRIPLVPISPVHVFVTEEVWNSTFPATRKATEEQRLCGPGDRPWVQGTGACPVSCDATHEEIVGSDVLETTYSGFTEKEKDTSCCEKCKNEPACEYWVRATGTDHRCWLKKAYKFSMDSSIRRGGFYRHNTPVGPSHRSAELCERDLFSGFGSDPCVPIAEDSDPCAPGTVNPDGTTAAGLVTRRGELVGANCRQYAFHVIRPICLRCTSGHRQCYGQPWYYALQNDACFVSSIATTLYDGSIPQANDDFTEGDGHTPTSFIEECHQYDPGSVCSASSKTCRPSTAPANNWTSPAFYYGKRQVMNENEYNRMTAKDAVMLQVQAYLTGDFTGYTKDHEQRALTVVPPPGPSTGSKFLEWVTKGTIDSDKVFSSVVAFGRALKFASTKIVQRFPAAAGKLITGLASLEVESMMTGPGMAICAVIGLVLVNFAGGKSPLEEFAKMLEKATNYIVNEMRADFKQLADWMHGQDIDQKMQEVMDKVLAIREDFDAYVDGPLHITAKRVSEGGDSLGAFKEALERYNNFWDRSGGNLDIVWATLQRGCREEVGSGLICPNGATARANKPSGTKPKQYILSPARAAYVAQAAYLQLQMADEIARAKDHTMGFDAKGTRCQDGSPIAAWESNQELARDAVASKIDQMLSYVQQTIHNFLSVTDIDQHTTSVRFGDLREFRVKMNRDQAKEWNNKVVDEAMEFYARTKQLRDQAKAYSKVSAISHCVRAWQTELSSVLSERPDSSCTEAGRDMYDNPQHIKLKCCPGSEEKVESCRDGDTCYRCR